MTPADLLEAVKALFNPDQDRVRCEVQSCSWADANTDGKFSSGKEWIVEVSEPALLRFMAGSADAVLHEMQQAIVQDSGGWLIVGHGRRDFESNHPSVGDGSRAGEDTA